MRLFTLTLLTVITTGCASSSLSLEIDGQRGSEALSGFYVELDDQFTDDDGIIAIILNNAGWEDPCDTFIDIEDEWEDANDPEESAEVWEEFYPDETWSTTISIRVDDLDDDQSGEVFEGIDADDQLGEESAVAYITHYNQPLDEAFYEGEADYEDYVSDWVTDRGELKVSKHVPGERIKGRFTAEIGTYEYDWDNGDLDYDAVGDATFAFDVERCRDAEDLWD